MFVPASQFASSNVINLVPSVQVIGNVNTGDQNPIPTFGARLLRTWLSVYIANHLKNGNQELMLILSLIECMYFFSADIYIDIKRHGIT